MKPIKIIGAVLMMISPGGCVTGEEIGFSIGIILFAVGFALFVAGRLFD